MERGVNILFVMTGKPADFGGGERVFLQLMEGLSKDTFNIFSCCPLKDEQKQHLKALGVRIIGITLGDNPFVSISKLFKVIRRENIHLVHSQGARAHFYTRVASRMANIQVIINTVAMLVERYDVGLLKKYSITCSID